MVFVVFFLGGHPDDTIVIFASDHGDYMGGHGLILQLLLHCQSIIRVPFLWIDPEATSCPRLRLRECLSRRTDSVS